VKRLTERDVAKRSRPGSRALAPVTDYTLAKRSVIAQYRRGVLTVFDVCDAHPELMRAARNIGRKVDQKCPICSHESLRLVRYVFGDELKQLSGRPVYPDDWAQELAAEYDEFRCYAVEVCLDCSWNHLVAVYLMGRRYSRSGKIRRRAAAST
jgi:uncharacterized protein DUF5318